jgi:hypothetical protein
MAQIKLGRVCPVFRGTYSNTTTYTKLDIVLYDNCSWVCVVPSVVGSIPQVGNNKWQLVAGNQNADVTNFVFDYYNNKTYTDY